MSNNEVQQQRTPEETDMNETRELVKGVLKTYADEKGNSISIEKASDGVSVSARIKTLGSPYAGGANEEAARKYAQDNKLEKQ